MSTLSLRRIKHDSASVDNITLNTDGGVSIGGSSISYPNDSTIDYLYIGSNGYQIAQHGVATRLRIDGSGRITLPNQPFFLARNGDESGDGITTQPFRFSNVIHNIGNHFVTSGTGAFSRFVAPVNGVYAFTTNPGYKQTSLDFVCRARVNGTFITDVVRLIGGPNSHSGGCYGFNIYLSANDFVDITPDGTTYHRNNSNVPNWFSGVLLG